MLSNVAAILSPLMAEFLPLFTPTASSVKRTRPVEGVYRSLKNTKKEVAKKLLNFLNPKVDGEKEKSQEDVEENDDDEEEENDDEDAQSEGSNADAIVNGDEEVAEGIRWEVVKSEVVELDSEVKEEEEMQEVDEESPQMVRKSRKAKNVEKEDDDSEASTSENSNTNEFRSNLIDLSTSDWERKVKEYGIKNPPSKRDRFEMSQKVLNALEAEYGEKLNETLKYYTFHEFSTDILKKPDEVIGLLLYLDVKEFVGTSFFFLLLATNDMDTTERAIPLITPLCQSQFKFIKIDKSRSLGKNVNEEWNTLQSEIGERRRQLHLCYPLLFSSVLKKRTMALFTQETTVEEREKKRIKQEPIDFELNKKIKKEKMDDGMDIDDFCEVIDVPKKRVKVEIISDEEAGEKKKRKKKKSESRNEENDEAGKSKEDADRLGRVKEERMDEAESTSTSAFHKDGYEDRASSKGDSREDDDAALISFRQRLVELNEGYWEYILEKWKVSSHPSTEEKYKIARVIIRFLDEKFGEDFHQMLFNQTTIKFTPSDLQEQEEVIGLVLWMDRLKFPAHGFFTLLIATNRESDCGSLLLQSADCFSLRLEVAQLAHRFATGEMVQREQRIAHDKYRKARKDLTSKFSTLFPITLAASTCKKKETDNDLKVEKMKSTVYRHEFWEKYAVQLKIKISDVTEFEICENAVAVILRLNDFFGGSLFTFMNATNKIKYTVDQIRDIPSRQALNMYMRINTLKMFPKELVFLLLRNRDDRVLSKACGMLYPLLPTLSKILSENLLSANATNKDLKIISKNPTMIECIEMLTKNVLRSTNRAFTSSDSLERIPPVNGYEWKCNEKWKVVSIWKKSTAMEMWESKKNVEMEIMTEKIEKFAAASVTRLEHYNAKLEVFNYMRNVLEEVLKKTSTWLTITGSSLSALGAANSNLDVFITSADKSAKVQLNQFVDVLIAQPGVVVETTTSAKNSREMTITNASTGGKKFEVSINVVPATLYMSYIFNLIDNQDIRVSQLTMCLKAWRILEPACKDMKIQSYHIVILLVHYLQCAVSPPILPSIKHYYPTMDTRTFRDQEMKKEEPIPKENTQSLSSLLHGFFSYYANFEFEKYIISIREGTLFHRPSSDASICVSMEHPYTPYLDVPSSATTDLNCGHVRQACYRAKNTIESSFRIPAVKLDDR